MEPEVPTGQRWSRSVSVVFGPALCAAATVRLSGAAFLFVPRWLALIALIFGVFATLEVLSVAWNIVRGKPHNERTFLDYISDALVWLPWP